MEQITRELVKNIIVQRKQETHKYNYGRVLLVGGNQNYGGAIIMSAKAAVNSGAGLVTVASDSLNVTSLHSLVPEATFADYHQLAELTELIKKAQVITIGSGLGISNSALDLLKLVFKLVQPEQVLIIDGSAFSLLRVNQLNLPVAKLILTPHQGEWTTFSGLAVEQQTPDQNRCFLKKTGLESAVLVLKKHRTEIYYQERIWQNPTGNASMATAGMGDTLAGMIAGFTAQFADFSTAVAAAVYLHGAIGDKLAQDLYVTIPTAIAKKIPEEMKLYSI